MRGRGGERALIRGRALILNFAGPIGGALIQRRRLFEGGGGGANSKIYGRSVMSLKDNNLFQLALGQ